LHNGGREQHLDLSAEPETRNRNDECPPHRGARHERLQREAESPLRLSMDKAHDLGVRGDRDAHKGGRRSPPEGRVDRKAACGGVNGTRSAQRDTRDGRERPRRAAARSESPHATHKSAQIRARDGGGRAQRSPPAQDRRQGGKSSREGTSSPSRSSSHSRSSGSSSRSSYSSPSGSALSFGTSSSG
jgi:hypothetical protein